MLQNKLINLGKISSHRVICDLILNKFQNYYTLNVDSTYGDSGDAFMGASGAKFSTFDRDNDGSYTSCAELYKGAWWLVFYLNLKKQLY